MAKETIEPEVAKPNLGQSVATWLKARPWIVPGAIAGAGLGTIGGLWSPKFSLGSLLSRLLVGGLLGGATGWGVPALYRYLYPEEPGE